MAKRGAQYIGYTMPLPDGQIVFIQMPSKWCRIDADGELCFRPPAVRFLDKVQVLAMKLPQTPTPGFIRTLRQTLGLTQTQLAELVGVDKMTVARWEWGKARPGLASLTALDRLRKRAGRKGVNVAA